MKKLEYMRVFLCLIFMFIIYININQKSYILERMEFSVEKADDYKQQNYEEQNNLTPIDEMAENEKIDIIIEQLKAFLTTNDLENFSFLPEETPICVYEGITEFDTSNETFALYKETIEKDIVFVNIVFVEKETENIYTWREEELFSIGILDNAKIELSRNLTDETDYNLELENMTEDELLDRVMEVLAQNRCIQLNLIYDGTIEFLNRNYYMISSFDNFEDHILRKQSYYIDNRNGYIYRAEENADYLRTELFYVGNLKTN